MADKRLLLDLEGFENTHYPLSSLKLPVDENFILWEDWAVAVVHYLKDMG